MRVIIGLQNYKIRGIRGHNYLIGILVVSLRRFLFQKKVVRGDKIQIKICKIPVYSKQIEG